MKNLKHILSILFVLLSLNGFSAYDGNANNVISLANSTTTLLAANDTFTGEWENVKNFTTVAVSISGDLETANGTLLFDVSHNGTDIHGIISATVPNSQTFDKPHILNLVEEYIRIRYVNGDVGQTEFSLQTKYSNGQELGLLNSVEEEIFGSSEAQIVKSVSVGQKPLGNYDNQRLDGLGLQTSTNLIANDTFSSNVLSLEGYTQVSGIFVSDQVGTFQALFLGDELGTDTIRVLNVPYNGDLVGEAQYLAAPAFTPYVQYKFINGATPQTDFYFDIKLVTKSINGQILGIESFIAPNMVANLGRSVIAAKDANGGDYLNILANNGGALAVADFLTEVTLGNIPSFSFIEKFGQNPAINTGSSPEDVWAGGGDYTGQPVGVAETVDVFSSDSDDDLVGTGARTVEIFGLDASFNEQSEIIELDGTNPVTSSGTYSRVFRLKVLTGGSSGGNEGILTVRHTTTTANVFVQVNQGVNQTTIAAYTIPDGKRGIILSYYVGVVRANGADGSALIGLRIREEGGVFRAERYDHVSTSAVLAPDLSGGILVPARSDIKVRIESVSDNGTEASATLGILLIDE